jgi:hypothetical protein
MSGKVDMADSESVIPVLSLTNVSYPECPSIEMDRNRNMPRMLNLVHAFHC